MRITIISIIFCFLGSVLMIGFLQLLSVSPNQYKNHFIRVFPSHFLGPSRIFDLKEPDYYLAGLSSQFFYLGNYQDPRTLLVIDRFFSNYKTIQFQIPVREMFTPSILHLAIDSPYVYLNNYATGSILRGQLSETNEELISIGRCNISTSIFLPVSNGYFAIRTFDSKLHVNVLGKLIPDSPFVRLWPNILERKGDGIFSTDGMLRHDAITGQFVYIYFYRNQFVCLDSNFDIRYRGQTLDTNVHAKIRVVNIADQHTSSIASPDFHVSRAACLNSDWIFIQSGLRADNEEKDIFNEYNVMDVYGLNNGLYHFSFYLPKGKIRDLAVRGNTLIAIQENKIVSYDLNMQEIRDSH